MMSGFFRPDFGVWKFAGYGTLGSANANLTVTLNASYRFLWCLLYVSGYSGAGIAGFRFNADTATNYGQSVSDSSAAATNSTAQTAIRVSTTAVTTQRWVEANILNIATAQKGVIGKAVTFTSGGTTCNMNHFAGHWNNTSAAITSITINSSANNLNAGTELLIMGRGIQ